MSMFGRFIHNRYIRRYGVCTTLVAIKKTLMKKERISYIVKQLLATGKIDEAFQVLLAFIRSYDDLRKKFLDDVILISSRYANLKNSQVRGIISNSEATLEVSRIISSILNLINKIESEVQIDEKSVKLIEDNNITFNDHVEIEGDFSIDSETKNTSETLVEKSLRNNFKIKILFLASSPANTSFIRLDKEMRGIEEELTKSKYRDYFEFIKISAVRIKDFQEALLRYNPNFVHFSGHGSSDGISLLDNRFEDSKIVRSEPLANLFKLFTDSISAVFLNSCFSYEQAILIRKYIPNVIGMKSAIPDETAIQFASTFYRAIGEGKNVNFSFEFAKISVELNNISGSNIPVIL